MSEIIFFRKDWTISIADKYTLAGRIEKIKYSIKYYYSRLSNACIENFTSGDMTAWRQFIKVSLSEKNKKGQKEGLMKNTKTSQKKEILELKGSQGLVLNR